MKSDEKSENEKAINLETFGPNIVARELCEVRNYPLEESQEE